MGDKVSEIIATDDPAWMMIQAFQNAVEPESPHCAYIFGVETAAKRGAYGRWCDFRPRIGSQMCHKHESTIPEEGRSVLDCIFCDIVAGSSPANIVERWSETIAFVPLSPVVDGHVLIVPTRHVAHFGAAPAVSGLTMTRAAEFAQRYESFNIITSAGRAATQSIDHLHIHVVPRVEDDKLMTPWGTIYGDDPTAPHWCRVAQELSVDVE